MSHDATTRSSERFASLDIFRGITIAGMILVNNPGNRKTVYEPLEHAVWLGWTPTDLVFPFFLFIVGVAITLSLDRRLAKGHGRLPLLEQVVRRSLMLALLGLILGGMPDWRLIGPYLLGLVGTALLFHDDRPISWPAGALPKARKILGAALLLAAVAYFALDFGYFQDTKLRIPGVLQRIAVCYFCAAIIALVFRTKGRAAWAVGLSLGYWFVLKYVPAPAGDTSRLLGPEGALLDWIDARLLGEHVSGSHPDALGILSTLPAVATTLIGVLTGEWLLSRRDAREKARGLFFAANVLLVAGMWSNYSIPISKKLWSTSYVLFTGGAALAFLGICYWLADIRGWRRWAWPFLVFGTNAIAVFCVSSVVSGYLIRTKVAAPDGTTVILKQRLFDTYFAPLATDPRCASLIYAICYTLLWLVPLVPLYRKRWFIKV